MLLKWNIIPRCFSSLPGLKTKFHKLLFGGLEKQGLGKWGFAPDPIEMAHLMIAHIDKKRKELGIDKARERTLVDMADRRAMDAA